jgi:hypothetical protein
MVFAQSSIAEAERYERAHQAEKLEVVTSVRNVFDQEVLRVITKPGEQVPEGEGEDSLDA